MLVKQRHTVIDDPMPPVQMLGEVPSYALDQFTRIGNTVSRVLVKEVPALRSLLDTLRISPSRRSQAIGDALFLTEGGLLKRRVVWPFADTVRKPDRMLPSIGLLGNATLEVADRLASAACQVANLRQQYFHPIHA